MSDSTASEPLQLEPNPPSAMPLSTPDFRRLQEMHSDLWKNPEDTCLTCGKEGGFLALRQGEEVRVRCDCMEQWKLHMWMLNAGLGLTYQRLSWDHLAQIADGPNEKIVDYLNHSSELVGIGHGLTLWGPPGTGKTMVATLVQRHLMAAGVDAYFCLFNQLISLHTAGWRSDDARLWFERRVMNAKVLVIDDIGKERMPQNDENFLTALVDELLRRRIQNARPTIVTTNLSPKLVEDRYYSGTLGLFEEVNETIELQGENFRERQRRQYAAEQIRGIRRPVVVG